MSGKKTEQVTQKPGQADKKPAKDVKVQFDLSEEELDKVSGGAHGAAGSGWGCTNGCGR